MSAGDEQYVLLTADRHWDNPHSDRRLQKEHLDMARERNAPIIDIGDFFCAMQGKFDPRRSMDDIRPEHVGQDYLGLLLDTAEEWFAPYADLFAVMGTGNHETAILKNNGLDLTRQIARKLRNRSGKDWPVAGHYGGYVRFRFRVAGETKISKTLKYYHGSGGGGPVTKGVIQTNRRGVYIPDADIIATGHIHEQWLVTTVKERINNLGSITLQNQYHVCVPTYKEEYDKGQAGFHVERGRPPKPVGCVWMKFSYRGQRDKRRDISVTFEIGD